VLTEQRRRDTPGKGDERLGRVTPRERQIVDLLSAGASNKEIAKRLNVTERTVKAHLTAIFRKLGLSGRLQLALFALEYGRSAREPEAIGPRFN
jgi:DNA-binding NarL/FixJ family response regulator